MDIEKEYDEKIIEQLRRMYIILKNNFKSAFIIFIAINMIVLFIGKKLEREKLYFKIINIDGENIKKIENEVFIEKFIDKYKFTQNEFFIKKVQNENQYKVFLSSKMSAKDIEVILNEITSEIIEKYREEYIKKNTLRFQDFTKETSNSRRVILFLDNLIIEIDKMENRMKYESIPKLVSMLKELKNEKILKYRYYLYQNNYIDEKEKELINEKYYFFNLREKELKEKEEYINKVAIFNEIKKENILLFQQYRDIQLELLKIKKEKEWLKNVKLITEKEKENIGLKNKELVLEINKIIEERNRSAQKYFEINSYKIIKGEENIFCENIYSMKKFYVFSFIVSLFIFCIVCIINDVYLKDKRK